MAATVAHDTAESPVQLMLDAAERLLIKEGYAAVTARRVGTEAGLNHGLIHYYFGSMEELLVQTLERFTTQLIARQKEMYSTDVSFLEKWRTAMSYLESDQASGYQKIWLELQAMSWNQPDLRGRVAAVDVEWRAVLTAAFAEAAEELGIDTERFPVAAIVSLVATFNQGIILERLSGITDGQQELLQAVDRWLEERERAKA